MVVEKGDAHDPHPTGKLPSVAEKEKQDLDVSTA
jgi:hypothetical protein